MLTDRVKLRCSVCGEKVVIHLEAEDKPEMEYIRKELRDKNNVVLCEKCKLVKA